MLKPCFAICLFIVGIFSCDDKKATKDSSSSTSVDSLTRSEKDTAGKDAPGKGSTFVDIPVKEFRIERTDLANQFNNSGRPVRLLIFKTHFSDLLNTNTFTLLVYTAKKHEDHGEDQSPLAGVTALQATSNIPTNIVIGNNYIDLKKILKRSEHVERTFTYLRLKPETSEYHGLRHLVYRLFAVTATSTAPDTLTEEDLGLTNPSPPAPPLEN